MDKTSKTLLRAAATVIGIAGAAAGLEGISQLKWGRSGIATAWAGYQRTTGVRAALLGRDLKCYEDYVAHHREENEREYVIPKWVPIKSLIFEETCDGMKT